jgi:hypothetical protein
MSFFGPAESAAFATFASDAIAIQRRTNTTGREFTIATIYSGAADLQEGGGSTYFNPGGAVEVADALLIVSADAASDLPAVQVGDVVTRTSDGKTFTVASVSSRTWQLIHLELQLKRGGLPMVQK